MYMDEMSSSVSGFGAITVTATDRKERSQRGERLSVLRRLANRQRISPRKKTIEVDLMSIPYAEELVRGA
jgi:hypothetical protein